MFGGFGIPELLIVLVIVLVFFGAGKLPEIGSALGKGIRGFRSSVQDGGDESKDEEDKAPESLEQKSGDTIEGETVERKEEEKRS